MAPSIISGGLIRPGSQAGRVAVALPVTETWTVGDAPGTLNGDFGWVQYIGANGWGVASQAARLTNGGGIAHGGRLNVPLGTSDYQVTATISSYSPDVTGLLSIGPCVRMQGDTSLTFYTAVIVASGGSSPVAILFKFVAGVQTQIGASVPVTVSPPTFLTLRVEGESLRVFVDGALVIDETDTAILTGQYAGLQGVASGLNQGTITTLAVETLDAGQILGFTPLTLEWVGQAFAIGSGDTVALDPMDLAWESPAFLIEGPLIEPFASMDLEWASPEFAVTVGGQAPTAGPSALSPVFRPRRR